MCGRVVVVVGVCVCVVVVVVVILKVHLKVMACTPAHLPSTFLPEPLAPSRALTCDLEVNSLTL